MPDEFDIRRVNVEYIIPILGNKRVLVMNIFSKSLSPESPKFITILLSKTIVLSWVSYRTDGSKTLVTSWVNYRTDGPTILIHS